jgi:hypothetical protein
VSNQKLGNALYDVGSYAAGGTVVVLLFCGGAALWSNDARANPILNFVGWGMVIALVGGLLLMGVGYVLRETADPESADLGNRVQKLEAEVARLRAIVELTVDTRARTRDLPAEPISPPLPHDERFRAEGH